MVGIKDSKKKHTILKDTGEKIEIIWKGEMIRMTLGLDPVTIHVVGRHAIRLQLKI